MTAPKINGYEMQEMHNHDGYVRWKADFNSGSLSHNISITVIKDGNLIYSSINVDHNRIYLSEYSEGDNPEQEAADKAVKYLNTLSNLLKNIGFCLDK